MVLLVQHIIEMLGCHEKTRTEFILISVLNRESLAKDTVLSICKFEFVPRYSSLLDICFRLQVEDTCDTSFAHLFDIIISKRIGSKIYLGVTNLVEVQAPEEVGIRLVNDSVYNPNFLLVFELHRTIFT